MLSASNQSASNLSRSAKGPIPSAGSSSTRDGKSRETNTSGRRKRARHSEAREALYSYEPQPRLVSSANEAKLAAIRKHLDDLTRHMVSCLNRKDSVDPKMTQHLSPAMSCFSNEVDATSREGHLDHQRDLWSRYPYLHCEVVRLAVYLDENVLSVLNTSSVSEEEDGPVGAAIRDQSDLSEDSPSSLDTKWVGSDSQPVSRPSSKTADAEVWVDLEIVGEPAASITKEGVYALHWRLPSGRRRWTCTEIRGLRSGKLF